MLRITLYLDCANAACWQAFEQLPGVLQALPLHAGYHVRYWPVAWVPDAELPPGAAQARYWLAARSLQLPLQLPNRYSCGVALRHVWGQDGQPALPDLPESAPSPERVHAHLAQLTAQAQRAGVQQLPCLQVGENPALVLSLEDLANSLM